MSNNNIKVYGIFQPQTPTKLSKALHHGKSSEELKDADLYKQYCEFLDAFFKLNIPNLIKNLFSYIYTIALEHHHTDDNPQRACLSSAFAACYQFGIMKQLPPNLLQDRIFGCTFRNIFDNVFDIEIVETSGSSYDLWRKISTNSDYDPDEPTWPDKKALVTQFLNSLCPQILADFDKSENEAENNTHRRKRKK